MTDLIKFLTANPDTVYTNGSIIAYVGEDIMDIYDNANACIHEYFENKKDNVLGFIGFEIIAECFGGSYSEALEEIKKEIL